MSVVAFSRFRFLWGAVDWQAGSNNPYASAQTGALGSSAAAGSGNIGVRRALITIDRTAVEAGLDPAEMHFDFLNITSGSPDDTWTTGDYTTLESLLDAFFTTNASYLGAGHKVTQYAWYRAGAGIVPPNPAERTLVKTTPIAGTGAQTMPLQTASSITFRTAVRRSWGRTYFPMQGVTASVTTGGRFSTSQVDQLCTSCQALATNAASSDFYLGVVSKKLSAFLVAEKIEVDNVSDIIRRRRHKSTTYKKILP